MLFENDYQVQSIQMASGWSPCKYDGLSRWTHTYDVIKMWMRWIWNSNKQRQSSWIHVLNKSAPADCLRIFRNMIIVLLSGYITHSQCILWNKYTFYCCSFYPYRAQCRVPVYTNTPWARRASEREEHGVCVCVWRACNKHTYIYYFRYDLWMVAISQLQL